ncbi:MAG: type II toxin-antitoxin system HicA family toxin [Nanoarchaeota archaeon]
MKLPILSGKEMVKILSKYGFEVLGQKGSHVIMVGVRNGMKRKPVVPMHSELRKGTLLSILKQADLTKEDLEKALKYK